MNIGIYVNRRKPAAADTLAALAAQASGLGIKLVTCDPVTARLAPGARQVSPARFGRSVDLLLSLGGDGTVLQAVHLLDGAKAPILGINLGNLGFLTSVPETHAADALLALAKGHFSIAEYPLLEARLFRDKGPKPIARARALNDIVLGWGTSPRATMIEVDVNRQQIASFVCDGLIVATPIGSTGHALSAGGPILHRETSALVIEPICPHTLSNRPLVLPNNRHITLRAAGPSKKLLLSVDGRDNGWIQSGDRLEITMSRRTARFVHLPRYSWFRLVSQKLHWRGSSADPK